MRPLLLAIAGVSLSSIAFVAGPSSAQPQDKIAPARDVEATIYRDANFRGPAMAVQRPEADLRLAWPVYAIRIARGSWQLCSAPNFQGNCVTVTRDESNLSGRFGRGNVLRSIRPIDGNPGWPGGPGGPGGPGAGDPGQSLRGMAAEFYPRPMSGRNRVLACRRGSASASCAAQTADQFCRQHGWAGAAREAMETANRQVYLADVLCSRTGH